MSPGASSAPFSNADLLEMHRRMLVIRGFEERVSALYRDGEVPGFVHLSIGQEAAAVGACWPLRPTDVITSTHRGHGHCLAKGLSPLGMFAELMAKEAGTNRGRGGSMHIADPHIGIFGANGIVGAGLPIAVGAATAARLRGELGFERGSDRVHRPEDRRIVRGRRWLRPLGSGTDDEVRKRRGIGTRELARGLECFIELVRDRRFQRPDRVVRDAG